MISVDGVKSNVTEQEIKELLAVSYTFLWEVRTWGRVGGLLLNGQFMLKITKVIPWLSL